MGHLKTKIQTEKWSASYAVYVHRAVKQFIRWTWEVGALAELPRNFDKLTIEVPTTKNDTFSVEELRQLFEGGNDRDRLYLCLMLNTGMLQQDISDLRQHQVDWDRGILTRKRSKTGDWESVPTVSYSLWPCTLELLGKFRSSDPEFVLCNQDGGRLKSEKLVAGRLKKTDNIKSAYFRLTKRLKIEKPKPLKLIRKTSASFIEERAGKEVAEFFLGHSPRTIGDKHYLQGPQDKLNAAIRWLEVKYGLKLATA